MRFSILDIGKALTYWLALKIGSFAIYLSTEKWWSHGHEHIIGVRFGDRIYEKRWGQ
jgi:hypothetical protein